MRKKIAENNERERNLLVGNFLTTKKWLLISMSFIRWGEFYLRVFSSLSYLKSKLELRNNFFFQFDFVFLNELFDVFSRLFGLLIS